MLLQIFDLQIFFIIFFVRLRFVLFWIDIQSYLSGFPKLLVRSTGISISNRQWNEFWKFAYLFLSCKQSKTDYWLEVWTTSLPLTSSIQLLQILKVAKVAIRYQDCSINSLLRRVQIFSLQNVLERADINNVSNLIMHEGHL